MIDNQRSCIGCWMWSFEAGSGGPYSDETPGDEWAASCGETDDKGAPLWTMYGTDISAGDWFNTMRKAETCEYYTPRDGAPR